VNYQETKTQIDLLRDRINAHGALSAEVRKKIDYKFRLDWNYYSNSMEGNTLTMDETRSVMVGNLTVGGKPIKDVLEMRGHDIVVSDILKVGKGEVRLSEARIKDIHRGIMHEDDPEKQKKIGVWKPEPNYMFNYKGERFEFAAPDEVPTRMHDLLNRTNAAIDALQHQKKNAPHGVDVALQFHLEYVAIHPFYDGNGRTARILTNLLLISLGYPPFWVKTEEREAYGRYLGDIQGYGGSPELFFAFAGGLILRSQQLMLDAIEGKEIGETGDLKKKIRLLKSRVGSTIDESVEREYAEDVIRMVAKEDVLPLYEAVMDAMKPLESLFKSRLVQFWIDSVPHNLRHLTAGLPRITMPVERIKILTGLRGFRKNSVPFDAESGFEFRFHPFVYEVYGLQGEILLSKLYNQRIDEEERKVLSEAIVSVLVTAIESELEKQQKPK